MPQSESESEDDVIDDPENAQSSQVRAPIPESMNSNRSLDEFMQILGADQDFAPNVWPNVADLLEKI